MPSGKATYRQRDILLTRFPFSDLIGSNRRTLGSGLATLHCLTLNVHLVTRISSLDLMQRRSRTKVQNWPIYNTGERHQAIGKKRVRDRPST